MNVRLRSAFSRLAYPLALLVLVAVFAGGYLLRGATGGSATGQEAPTTQSVETPLAKAMIWTCSMHPQIRQPNPGKCPICAMDLIPAGDTDDAGGDAAPRRMSFSPAATAMMRVNTVPVSRGTATGGRSLLGKVAADETRLATVAAWVPGRIEKMHIAFTGEVVAAGQALVTLYSPDLLTAASELKLALAALARSDEEGPLRAAMEANVAAARSKLLRWGLDDRRIDSMLQEGHGDRVVITAEASGTVVERLGQEGMYVETGEAIYRLADLSRVWVNLEAYESDLQSLALGASVSFTAEALPGRVFTGEVEFIDPVLDAGSRVALARVSLPNPEGLLRPGMFVRAFADAVPSPDEDAPLMIPATAPLLTGKRALVYVMIEGTERPTFESREIVLGARAGDSYPVLSGLTEGDLVVTHGNFQIDSAVQIQAKPSMMNPEILVEQWEGRKVAASETLKEQLAEVVLAHAAFADALKHPEMPGHERVLARLRDAVTAVAHDALPDDAHGLWSELAMKLSNDATAAWQLADPVERAEAAGLLAERVSMMQSVFGLANEPAPHTSEPIPALQPVFDAYLLLHEALAGDNETGAREQTKALLDAVESASGLPGAWNRYQENIAASLKGLSADAPLESLRSTFLVVSQAMVAVVKDVGIPPVESLHVAHCPMADKDQGADWLQRGKGILNPYYGSGMLTCGYVTETLTAPLPEPSPAGEHQHE